MIAFYEDSEIQLEKDPKDHSILRKIKDKIKKPKPTQEAIDFAIALHLGPINEVKQLTQPLGPNYKEYIRKINKFELKVFKTDIPPYIVQALEKSIEKINQSIFQFPHQFSRISDFEPLFI